MASAPRPHVRLQVEHGIQLEQLQNLVNHIVQLQPGGCRTCGLGGFDFSIVVDPDPALTKGFHGAPGVTGFTAEF
jgi:hypothetical protein